MLKVLTVDDHHLFVEGMRCLLERLGDPVTVLTATRAQDALSLAAQHPDIHVVLLDLGLPDSNGLQPLSQFRQAFPLLPVIILSACDEVTAMRQALESGASGYISKASKGNVMLHAIRLVLAGGIYVPPEMLHERKVARESAAVVEPKRRQKERRSQQRLPNASLGLTPRQQEVLLCVAEGLSNKQIADRLNIAEPTAKSHVTAVLKTLNVPNRTKAAQVAQKLVLGRE